MKQVQVINEKQEYLNCTEAITQWGMDDSGFDYHVVAVFGAQSSGKSTLLNHLFATEFDVMNAKGGRGQTTKGIWMSKDSDRNILIMDVEGTDGRERGEDQDFERKSALFSLATAEVLIINMFEQSVGLYNGANMSLLRTVLEVNLQLFQLQSSSKTCLLFVLRDSTGQTPLDTLADTLKTDLEKIWMTLSKPAGKETALISDYFDFSFANVAHKIFVPEKFQTDLDILKKRFTDKDDPNYLIKSKYHKGIPADGFPLFAQNIWSKIIANRDLDLPSQQQLLAQFRCEEIGNTVFEGFEQKIKPIKPTLDSGKVAKDFGSLLSLAFGDSIGLFEKNASRYHTATYEKKKKEFSVRLYSYLHILFLQQLRNLHRDALELFSGLLKTGPAEKNKSFGQRLSEAREKALQYHSSICVESKLVGSDWTFEDYSIAFKTDVEALLSQKRADELKRVSVQLQKLTISKLSDPLAQKMSACGPELWKDIFETFQSASTEVLKVSGDRTNDIGVTGDELLSYQVSIKIQLWNELLRLINEELADAALLEKMRRRFDSIFRYDEKGLPRIWSPTDDIESIFQRSKESVDDMLAQFQIFDMDLLEQLDGDIKSHEDYTSDSLAFINTSRKAYIVERFGREEDSLFLEAKRATVASKAEIPTWFLGLTIVLGWNEFLAIFRNPVLTAFLLVVLGAIYIVYYTNLAGPVLQIVQATTGEIAKQTKEELKKRGLDPEQVVQGLKTKAKEFLIYDQPQQDKKNEIEMKNM